MIEKLVLGEIWTGDHPIFKPDALTKRSIRMVLISRSFEIEKQRSKRHSCFVVIEIVCMPSLDKINYR